MVESDSGIIVEASRELILLGAERVISDFTMTIEKAEEKGVADKEHLDEGDSIIFKENIDICPVVVIATNLDENLWFVMTTAECPPAKCDDRQAMKCVRLNDQNLRIFQEFVNPREDAKILTEWRSSLSDEARLEGIIDRVSQRWTH